MSSWRPTLRLAWREAARSRARSLLVLVMIALPVAAVGAAATVATTAQVSSTDSIPRRMGSAQALVTDPGAGPVRQAPEPDSFSTTDENPTVLSDTPASSALRDVLGRSTLLPVASWDDELSYGKVVAGVVVTALDLREPVTEGLAPLRFGRLPSRVGEAAISPTMVDRGVRVGDRVDLVDGGRVRVVGVVASTTRRDAPLVFVPPGGEHPASLDRRWLVGGPPVTWGQVRALNLRGFVVASRSVLRDPPPRDEIDRVAAGAAAGGLGGLTLTVLALVVAMAVLEVVLLAGPSFAVSARRLSRSLALMAACGGTPRQARAVVLAGALILGSMAAAAGALLAPLLAWAVLPWAQSRSTKVFGPFEVPWHVLFATVACGLASALVATAVPAFVASRQDVVSVLAGRRGEGRPSLRTPLVGTFLLGGGVVLAYLGATTQGSELLIAFAAVFSVLGMVGLVPVVVVAVGHLSRWMPLSLRYAARDAVRHRSRTAPAVAAVAATVAGLVTVGLGTSSQDAATETRYRPVLPIGMGVLSAPVLSTDWQSLDRLVRTEAPQADAVVVRSAVTTPSHSLEWVRPRGTDPDVTPGGPLGSAPVLGGDVLKGLGLADDGLASRSLAGGTSLLIGQGPAIAGVRAVRVRERGPDGSVVRVVQLPSVTLAGTAGTPTALVVPEQVARREGWASGRTALLLAARSLSSAQQTRVAERAQGIAPGSFLVVERGFQATSKTQVVTLILTLLGAVLMLGGMLTATLLALSDARPDLATLGAVGASPGARRRIGAAYALTIGATGGVLGVLVGAVPGVAITYPLTELGGDPHVLAVPWLVLAVVVLVPLATAGLVAVTTRSRLPMVSRLG